MRLVLSQRFEDIPVDRAQWNTLVADSVGATVFQTYEWLESWWTAFGSNRQLFLITAWSGNALVGIAPLMTYRSYGIRHLELVGSPNADYQDFILGNRAEELLPQIGQFLTAHRASWDMMVLRNLPADSVTFQRFPGLLNVQGISTTDHERVACPTLEISTRQDETLRRLNSYSFRRRINRLRQLGELRYTRLSTAAEIERLLPLFFQQYMERRAGSNAAEYFSRNAVREFYGMLVTSMLSQGWLHFSVLECAGRPVAFHFGFEYRGRLYWYKPSFDPALAKLSPGNVLLSHLIRDALERDLDELDFTVGPEPFKYRYARTERTNVTVRAFARPWIKVIFGIYAQARRSLARWYRRSRL